MFDKGKLGKKCNRKKIDDNLYTLFNSEKVLTMTNAAMCCVVVIQIESSIGLSTLASLPPQRRYVIS